MLCRSTRKKKPKTKQQVNCVDFRMVSVCACDESAVSWKCSRVQNVVVVCLACSLWINKWFACIAKWWARISILIAMEYSDEITQAESNNNASCIPGANIEFKIDYHDVIIASRSWMESVTNLKINLMKLNKWLLRSRSRYAVSLALFLIAFRILFVVQPF